MATYVQAAEQAIAQRGVLPAKSVWRAEQSSAGREGSVVRWGAFGRGWELPGIGERALKIALRWMVCEAEIVGLIVDQDRKSTILGGKAPPYVMPDPLTTNQHESLHGPWWIAELWPKVVHIETAQGTWKKSIRPNLARRRWIAADSLFHESVEQRLAHASLGYKPSNLPQQRSSAQSSEISA